MLRLCVDGKGLYTAPGSCCAGIVCRSATNSTFQGATGSKFGMDLGGFSAILRDR